MAFPWRDDDSPLIVVSTKKKNVVKVGPRLEKNFLDPRMNILVSWLLNKMLCDIVLALQKARHKPNLDDDDDGYNDLRTI